MRHLPSLAGADDDELIAFEARDFRKETPVTDHLFEAYLRLFEYDRKDLQAKNRNARRFESGVAVRARFVPGGLRRRAGAGAVVSAKRGQPPYQAVVCFPASSALTQRDCAQITPRLFDWILKSGRAVILPIYKSTYERGDGLESDYPNRTIARRNHVIAWAKDVRHGLPRVERRHRSGSVAYMGLS